MRTVRVDLYSISLIVITLISAWFGAMTGDWLPLGVLVFACLVLILVQAVALETGAGKQTEKRRR